MNHTTGPWKLGTRLFEKGAPYGFNIAGADGYHVAKVSSRSAMEGQNAFEGENLANANLIAAAPELLEALKQAIEFANDANYHIAGQDLPQSAIWLEVVSKAEAQS